MDISRFRFDTRFVRNAWYCAAWAHELNDGEILARKILNEPVALFRDEAGHAFAVRDICSHRLAPLHLGRVVAGSIECGYHGLRFNGEGRCVFNPHDKGHRPSALDVRHFPLIERDGILWIWPGAPERADPLSIPDCSHMASPHRKTIRGSCWVQGDYRLLIENLMDLGHAYYLHQRSAGGIPHNDYLIEAGERDGKIYDNRIASDVPVAGWLADAMGDPNGRYDQWQDIVWTPISVISNHSGASRSGAGRIDVDKCAVNDLVVDQKGTHIITPETETSCHYFHANSRNYDLDNPALDEFWTQWQRNALRDEDSVMVEAIQSAQQDAEALGLQPISFMKADNSGVRVMRSIAARLEDEAGPLQADARSQDDTAQ